MSPDSINGLFELLGAGAIWLSVRKLREDKKVRGFHWGQLGFFTSWGIWNLYYYPHLDQWLSFVGGLAVVGVNITYLAHIYMYRKN